MKTALVGLGCLVMGGLGALGYSHYLGEGKQLAELQAQISNQDAALAKATKGSQDAKSETDAMSAQIQQLTATKQGLQKQVDDLKSEAAPATPPANPGFNGSPMAGLVKAQMASRNEAKFQHLVSHLNLTPDQQAALKAAMDAEDKRTSDMTAKILSGGKIDPAAVAEEMKTTKSVEQTLNDILTPDQKATYQQMKTDEKANNAEAMASLEMNQMATSLDLTDAQKDQVGSALYQNQLNMQDPAWIKANMPANRADPTAIIEAQAQAKEDALAKVLTPAQLATYHQQAQSQLEMQKAMVQKFMPASGATASGVPVQVSSPASP